MSHEIFPRPATKQPAHVPWRATLCIVGFTFCIFFFSLNNLADELENDLKISGIATLVVFFGIIEYNHTYRYWKQKDIEDNKTPFILICVSYLLILAVVLTPWLYKIISLGIIGIIKSISIVPPGKKALLFRNTKPVRTLLPGYHLTIPFVDRITIIEPDIPMLQHSQGSSHDKGIFNITNLVRYSVFSCRVSAGDMRELQYDFRITYGITHRYSPHISANTIKESIYHFIERYTNRKDRAFFLQKPKKKKIEQAIAEMVSDHLKAYFAEKGYTYIALQITDIQPC